MVLQCTINTQARWHRPLEHSNQVKIVRIQSCGNRFSKLVYRRFKRYDVKRDLDIKTRPRETIRTSHRQLKPSDENQTFPEGAITMDHNCMSN